MNTGVFAGRLGADAESRVTPSNTNVLNFDLAVDVGWGEQKSTLWVRCTLWGERGPKLALFLTKGKSITVSGDVGIKTYESKKDGKTHAQLTCNVQRVTLQGGGAPHQDRQGEAVGDPNAKAATPEERQKDMEFDDDIPF